MSQKTVKVIHPTLGNSVIPEDALAKFLANEWVLVKDPEKPESEKKPGHKYRHTESLSD